MSLLELLKQESPLSSGFSNSRTQQKYRLHRSGREDRDKQAAHNLWIQPDRAISNPEKQFFVTLNMFIVLASLSQAAA